MVQYDEEDFDDFLKQVEEVNKTVQGLKDGTIAAPELDKKELKKKKEREEFEARRERKRLEAEAAAQKRAEEKRKQDELRENNREKIEELKRDYYHRKARRERWEAYREENKSRAFTDYYKGWDLFEEDPDEDLFTGDQPAAVQDQAAFDAMAKDVEQRTAQRKASQKAAEADKDRGNTAFRAGQFTEAVSYYSSAVEYFKADKSIYTNRALAHLKLRNFLSALEDATRAIEISRYLDDDHERRPPPPTVLKAYVRRASAHFELGHYTEAKDDLDAAAAMASEKDLVEIKKQQRSLKEEMAAAKLEEELHDTTRAGAAVPSTVGAAAPTAAPSTSGDKKKCIRLRELLELMGGAVTSTSTEAPAAATEDETAERALELRDLLVESVACRVCLRQAGGVKLLLEQLQKPSASAAVRQTFLSALCVACSERRNQLEVHTCGGSSFLLRRLRKALPATEEGSSAHAGAGAEDTGAFATLDLELRLAAQICAHARVGEDLRRLAAGEGAHERLVLLLQPRTARAAMPGNQLLSPALQTAAAALVAALCAGSRAAKAALLPHKTKLVVALVEHLRSAHAPLVEQVVTAMGNLSAHPALRDELISRAALPALAKLVVATPKGKGEDCLLPNALATLHNCSMHAEALAHISTLDLSRSLLSLINSNRTLARRAAGVLSKGCTRNPQVVEMLISDSAVPNLAQRFVSEMEAGTGVAKSKEGAMASGTGAVVAEPEEGSEEEDVVGALLRILTACAPRAESARALCNAGALPHVVQLLRSAPLGTKGNAALCVAECANEARSLAVLATQDVVPPLLALAHNEKGAVQKNAAVALGRLAKNPHCLQAIRDNHGIEILARYMKPK